jgi:uncharacterized repeat protein (TIGR01451 family)
LLAPITLGAAASFAVLAGSTVTATPTPLTAITGNLGVSPGTAVTGFPPNTVTGGSIHQGDALAVQAEADLATAYNVIKGETPTTELSGTDLGGLTLTPGVYHFATSAHLGGVGGLILTLDGKGDPNARFDFQIGTTLISAAGASVKLINGAQANNVYFQVGTSATLGTGTAFQGNILADASITLTTGSTLENGRALAIVDAVTMDQNTVSAPLAIPPPNLSIVKTADATTINAGDTAAFTITVTNSGTGPASDVVVTDPLAAGIAWTTTTPGAGIGSGILTDDIGGLAPGASVVIHVSGPTTSATTGTVTDTATVTSSNNKPSSLSSTATITVNDPKLSIVKTADEATINAGDTAAFTITVNNSGPGTASDVVITDPLPPGVAWTTTTPGAVIAGGVLTDDIGSLASGGTAVVHLSGPTTPANSGTLNDTAIVTSTNNIPSVLTASATITVNSPHLAIVKTADEATINAGDTAAFTITVNNSGPGTASTVVVNDPLPAGVVWTTTTPGAVIAGGVLTDTIGSLAAGGSVVIHVSGPTTSATTGTVTDTATVTSTNNTPGSLSSTAIITVNDPKLAIVKTADAATINAGDTAAFTITVTNSGPGTASTVVVNDPLPAGVVWTTTTPGAVIAGGVLTDTIGSLASGGSVVIHVSGPTTSATTGTVTDTATVTSTNNTPGSLSSTAIITVNDPHLAIVKTADAATINAGDTAAFTITVTNSGPGTATNVVVNDPLPAGIVWTTTTPGAVIAGGVLTDTIGSLAAGGSVVIHVGGPTTSATTGTVTDTATVTSTNNAPGSLSSTAIITVNDPKLAIIKTADAATINAGDTAAFTITVTNSGPGTASNVVVNDPLPAGVVWTTTTPGAGIGAGVLTDTIGSLAAGGSVVIHVSGPTTSATTGTVTDTATVTSSNNTPGSLSATATITVNSPTLAIVKTADAATINAGNTAAFTITVTNSGPGTASNVVVNDPLSPGVVWTTTTPGAVIAGGVLTDTIGSLASGGSVVIHVSGLTHAHNTNPTTYKGSLVDTASVTSSNKSPSTLSASATITVLAPDVTVTKTADASPIVAGTQAGFVITVSNIGLGTAVGLHVADKLPTGVNWSVASGPGAISGLVLTAPSITSLAAGASFSIHVVAPTTVAGTLLNSVTASASNESLVALAKDTASAAIIVQPKPALVTVVSAVRSGIHEQATQYVVTFSGAVAPAQAVNLVHYQLVRVNSLAQVIGAPIPFGSAVYNPTAHTVTLLPRQHVNVHYDYRLTITGMMSAAGPAVVGSSGTAGSAYVTYFSFNSLSTTGFAGSTVPGLPAGQATRAVRAAIAAELNAGNPTSWNPTGIGWIAHHPLTRRTVLHPAH